ncbi:MICOS complex subunit, partial [Lachnellula subtilissima]
GQALIQLLPSPDRSQSSFQARFKLPNASRNLVNNVRTNTPPPVAARPSKPVSEALLNEKWDKCLSSFLIRSSLGLSFGVVFSVLLFKRRAWPAFVGLGFGSGRAYEECNGGFLRGAGKEGVRVQRP